MKRLTKTYLSILYFLLLTCFCQAQFSLGVRGGFHFAEIPITAEYIDIVEDINFRSAYQFGLVGNYQFTNNFSLQTEILYLQKGVGLDVPPDDRFNTGYIELYNFHYNYLEIPLLSKFSFKLNSKISLFLDAGFSYGYLYKGFFYSKYIDSDGEIYDDYHDEIDIGDDGDFSLDRNEYSFISGLGVSIPIRRFKINFDMRFSKGLTDLQTERDFAFHTKNRGFGFATSILYSLSK